MVSRSGVCLFFEKNSLKVEFFRLVLDDDVLMVDTPHPPTQQQHKMKNNISQEKKVKGREACLNI